MNLQQLMKSEAVSGVLLVLAVELDSRRVRQ